MKGQLILFITIHLVAMIYFIEVLRRVSNKSKEYILNEDSRTLPFGFVRLRYVVIAYIFAYVVWLVASFFLYVFYIDQSLSASFGSGNISPIQEFDLNL